MALKVGDRVKQTTTTTGTGTITLNGAAPTGFSNFRDYLSDGDTTYYVIEDGTNYEIGLGTFNTGGSATADTIARSSNANVYRSTNSNNRVDWSSGTRSVFISLPSDKAIFKDATDVVSLTSDVTVNGKVITMTGSANDTATLTAGTNGTFTIATTDATSASGDILLDADGDVTLDASQVLNLTSAGNVDFTFGTGGGITVSEGSTPIFLITNAGITFLSGTCDSVAVTNSTTNTHFPEFNLNANGGDLLLDSVNNTSDFTFNPSITELTLKGTDANDGGTLNLESSELDPANGDIIGSIKFATPDYAQGSDGATTAAAIEAEADATFSQTVNKTDLVFKLGSSGAATEVGRFEHEKNLVVGNNLKLNSDSSKVRFGVDFDVELVHVHDVGLRINSDKKFMFGDADTYIHQSADGVLDLVSDTEIEINATDIDINGDVDITGTLTVGVDDTGHDVKFFGATSGKYMEWDESADQLNVSGTLSVAADTDATTTLGRALIHSPNSDSAAFSHVDRDSLSNYALLANSAGATYINASGGMAINFNLNNSNIGGIITNGLFLNAGKFITYEGATADTNETTLTVTDPTADRTITLPDATGTVHTTANPEINGAYGSTSAPITFTVTVATQTAAHPYNGDGSSSKFVIDGIMGAALTLHGADNVTSSSQYIYRFDQADGTNATHPLRFYLDAAKSYAYTTGVTTNGTPGQAGAYTQIAVTQDTPQILYYQCSSHDYMGNYVIIPHSTNIKQNQGNITLDAIGGNIALTQNTGNMVFTNTGSNADITFTTNGSGVIKHNTNTVLTLGNSDAPTTTTSDGDADFVLIDDGGTMKKITPANLGIGTGGGVTVQDEGSSLSTAGTTLDFVGAGVTASGTGTTKTITIAGGSDGVTVQDEGSALSTTGTTLNFVGAGVTASGTGATKTITIAGGSGGITTGKAIAMAMIFG